MIGNQQAREAAWYRFEAGGDLHRFGYGGAFNAGFGSGVREGIRQAREAVVRQQQSEPWAEHYYPSDPLAAIDALGAD